MTLRKLPKAKVDMPPQNFQWDAPADVLAKWADIPMAADSDDDNTITMFEVIGEDWWTGGGVTAKRISAALRSIGNKDVVVKINSPGGDMFEGIAIYNLLRDHKAKVTIEIVGWAASAASIIAMAGDEIRMGLGTFFMIHNAWGMCVGNRHDMRESAELFDGFDAAMADIYVARTGIDRKEVVKLMDAETFMGSSEAKDQGFVDVIDESLEAPDGDAQNENTRSIMARRQVEAAMAKAGYSRRDRGQMLAEVADPNVAPRDASHPDAARDAGIDIAALLQLQNNLKT